MLEKDSSSIQIFNSSFVDDIKDLYINKTNKKSYLVVYTYNDKKKFFVLVHLLIILKVSQNISSYLAIFIQNNCNNNIKFYL